MNNKIEATAEIFITAFNALSKEEKHTIVTKLLRDKKFKEDLIDIVTIEQRKKESSISLEEYLSKRRKKSN
jgi:hypothetical protein